MAMSLYYVPSTPTSAVVLLVGRGLGVKFNLIRCDPARGDLFKPEFLRLNPMHTVPTIDHNGFVLWESRAICQYLINKYGPESGLIPKDYRTRGVYEQRLFFDYDFHNQLNSYSRMKVFWSQSRQDPERLKSCVRSLELLEGFLRDGGPYLAGDRITLVDYSSSVAVASCGALPQLNVEQYRRTAAWKQRIAAEVDGYGEIVEPLVQSLKRAIQRAGDRKE